MSLKTDKAFTLTKVKSGMTRTWGAVCRAFTLAEVKSSRGTNEVRGELASTKAVAEPHLLTKIWLNLVDVGQQVFRCKIERCRLTRDAVCHAFTLAEVIITIGIIGVVAVMVVVPFIKDIKDKDLATSATVFEKRLEEALKVMNTQDTLAGYDKTEDFVQSLAKNFKISKVCKNTELNKCFSQTIQDAEKNKIKTNNFRISDNFGVDFDTNIVGLRFANGVSALLAYDPNCESNPTNNAMPVMSCISMIYDVNGNGRPNKISSDVRLLNASLVDIDGSDAVIAKINGVKITKIGDSKVYGYVNCTDTESEDYKNYCEESTEYSADFWAGAVKYCGGKDKMASDEDLAKIAQYIYNDNSISSTGTYSDLTLDANKALELQGYGFPNVTSGFRIWAPRISTYTHSYSRGFETSKTDYNGWYDRGRTTIIAVCVKH